MKDSIINMGVIGLGAISGSHIPTYQKDSRVRLAAICDIDKPWLAFQKENLKVEHVYADYNELLANKEIDAVSVCLPTYLHSEATISALEAGKHVLCEKPMAVNAGEAVAMHTAAQKEGKKLMIRQNQRFEAGSQLLKKQIELGIFGDIYFIRTAWRRPMGGMPGPINVRADNSVYSRNWFNEKDKGGGVLRDLGCHLIDLAMYLTGFPEFTDASCSCYRKFTPDIEDKNKYVFDAEDLASAHLKFKNGMSMEIEMSLESFVEEDILCTEIYGTKAGASRRNGKIKFFRDINGAYTNEVVRQNCYTDKDSIEAFIDCIANNTEPPVTSAQGVEVIKVLDALYKSAGRII
ncbi:MAG: Gfo/Idh/MocA family oxidoreductase [Clostridiales bacterium]|nr:Gfo/Idh/MocA family oxidoreductase [Clostridiales bacterium]